MAARRKASTKKSAAANGAARGIGAIWKFIAKTLGSSIRFIFRGAQDLDPAHQRDGLAFIVFILGLISAAGVWFSLDNFVGHLCRSLWSSWSPWNYRADHLYLFCISFI